MLYQSDFLNNKGLSGRKKVIIIVFSITERDKQQREHAANINNCINAV